MKKIILVSVIVAASLSLSACYMTQVDYAPGYNTTYVYGEGDDTIGYVYTGGYYGYGPYFGTQYYRGYDRGYWGRGLRLW